MFFVFLAPVMAADDFSTGGEGTIVLVSGSNITIRVQLELWGDGVWQEPELANRWKNEIATIWNNYAGNTKYKCYTVTVEPVVIVSPKEREGPDPKYGTSGYHQIWVPDLSVGDLANAYSSYGLYYTHGDVPTTSYGAYDPVLAEQFKQQENKHVLAFVGYTEDPNPNDANQAATWGTWPNTTAQYSPTQFVVAHEFGHTMGLDHDAENCADNVMAPGSETEHPQIYPVYFKTLLEPLKLQCDWKVKTMVDMDATATGTYFPPKLKAHNEFTLTGSADDGFRAATISSPSDFIYDGVHSQFGCNVFAWETHNGKIGYTADLLYNFKEDLNTGGRLYLMPKIVKDPYEEIKAIAGCGRPDPNDLTKVNPINHHNLLYSLTGENLTVTPYDYHTDAPVSCAATEQEEPATVAQYYINGFIIEGATKDAKAEHFPNAKLYAADFTYDISVLDAQPQAK